jgi:hypothetical protein
MCKIAHLFPADFDTKSQMPIVDFSLNFVCPACGARPQEKCKLNSGASHIQRWDIAYGYQRSAAFCQDSPLSAWVRDESSGDGSSAMPRPDSHRLPHP